MNQEIDNDESLEPTGAELLKSKTAGIFPLESEDGSFCFETSFDNLVSGGEKLESTFVVSISSKEILREKSEKETGSLDIFHHSAHKMVLEFLEKNGYTTGPDLSMLGEGINVQCWPSEQT